VKLYRFIVYILSFFLFFFIVPKNVYAQVIVASGSDVVTQQSERGAGWAPIPLISGHHYTFHITNNSLNGFWPAICNGTCLSTSDFTNNAGLTNNNGNFGLPYTAQDLQNYPNFEIYFTDTNGATNFGAFLRCNQSSVDCSWNWILYDNSTGTTPTPSPTPTPTPSPTPTAIPTPTPMNQLFFDDFDRANGTLGTNWTQGSGSMVISSNVAKGNTVANHLYYENQFNLNNYMVEADVRSDNWDSYRACINIRENPIGLTGYSICETSTQFILYRRDSVTDTDHWVAGPTFASLGIAPPANSVFYHVGISVVGNQINVYWQNNLAFSATDSTYSSGYGAMFANSSSGNYFDNFSITDLSTSPTPTESPTTIPTPTPTPSPTPTPTPSTSPTPTPSPTLTPSPSPTQTPVPTATPTNQLFSDDFNRSDANTLGPNWTEFYGTRPVGVSNNQAYISTGAGGYWGFFDVVDLNTQDQDVSVDMTHQHGDTVMVARMQDINNRLWVDITDSSIGVGMANGGAYSSLPNSATPPTPIVGHTYHVELRLVGTSVQAWVDGLLFVNTTIPRAWSGSAGIGANDGYTNVTFDNFVVTDGTVSTPVPTPTPTPSPTPTPTPSQTPINQLFFDDFNRPDRSGLGSDWTQGSGLMIISSGMAEGDRTLIANDLYYENKFNLADYMVEADIKSDDWANYRTCINIRENPVGLTGYSVCETSTQFILYRRDTGVADTDHWVAGPTFASLGLPNPMNSVFYHVGISAVGNQIRVYWQNNLVFTATDSTYSSGYGAMFANSRSGNYFDNFSITDLSGTSTPTPSPTPIPNTAPDIGSIPDGSVAEGGLYSATGSFSDSDSTSWTGTVNYGDGSGTSVLSFSGTDFTLSHLYADGGTYTVTISITDNQGATSTTTTTITVSNTPPSITSFNADPNLIQLGDLASVNGTFTDPGVLDTHIAGIDWGDGNVSRPLITEQNGSGILIGSHTYTTGGIFTIILTLVDKDGGTVSTQTQITVNNPPTADAGGPYDVNEGGSVSLQGIGNDLDGDSLNYVWDLDHNGTFEMSGQNVTFLAADLDGPLSKIVTFQVCDNKSACATSDATINILNVAPTAILSNDGPINEGSSVLASFNDQFDPSSADVSAGFHYAFSCDGSPLAGVTYANSASVSSKNCSFADNGSYTVLGRIIDKDGGYTDYQTDVVVNNVSPVVGSINVTPSTTVVLDSAVGTNASFTDLGTFDTHTATWNWGDGSTTDGVVTETNGSGSVTGSHIYTASGVYTVILTVTDNSDSSGQSSTTITTINQISSLSPAQVWIGLKNSDDVGIKFDLLAEAYVNGNLISSGQLNSVTGGSSSFNNAHLQSISFNSFSPVDFPAGSTLSVKVYARNACSGSGHNSGTARLWYNDSQANSQLGSTIGTNTYNDYFLNNFILGTSVGSGPKDTIDISAGAKCSAFKSFGTWTITP
jgi:hypothetical protein